MSYTVQYRGGPNAGKREVLPNLPNELPMMTYVRLPSIKALWQNADAPVAVDYTNVHGVYSRVFTPQKNGTYLYVWIKK